jgi:hypothetical protein
MAASSSRMPVLDASRSRGQTDFLLDLPNLIKNQSDATVSDSITLVSELAQRGNYPTDPAGFLTGVPASIGELERDDRFATLRDAPWAIKFAALGSPNLVTTIRPPFLCKNLQKQPTQPTTRQKRHKVQPSAPTPKNTPQDKHTAEKPISIRPSHARN